MLTLQKVPLIFFGIVLSLCQLGLTLESTPNAIKVSPSWFTKKFDSTPGGLPFSFIYRGKPSPETPEETVRPIWQYDRPDLSADIAQAFRRPASTYSTAQYKLRNLDVEAEYSLTDVNADMRQPLLITYKKVEK